MRGIHRRALAAAVLGAAALGLLPPAARAEAWKDEKLGYGFAYPTRWNVVPVDAGNWLVAKFTSNREYEWADSKNNLWTRHRPYLEVVCIPYSAKSDKGATVEVTDKGAKVTRTAPWKDLKEYMDKSFQERRIGGFYFSAEDEATINGLKVRRLEITVDKNVEGDRRIFGWEFAGEDCYWGLVAEILVQEEKGLKPELFKSFATFRTFPRTGVLPNSARTGEDVTVVGGDKKEEDLSPEERKKRRQEATGRALERIKQNLPPGWKVVEGKNFIAVTHTDDRFTREVLTHAEALRAWLEKEFGYVGSGFAGKVIIRILADNQEYQSYTQSRVWSYDAPEALTYKDKEGWVDWNMDSLNGSIYDIWMRDKNERLLWAFPDWLQWGLRFFVQQARSKNGRIEFKADIWDSVQMKNIRRADEILLPRTYFTMTSGELWVLKDASTQSQFFVNFLVAGAASRSPRYRNVLPDYIKSLIFLLDMEPAAGPADAKEPQNEKEEQEMVKARQKAWRDRENEIAQKLLERTFSGWSDRDWDAFAALYRQDLK
jgi:hypothetical protein